MTHLDLLFGIRCEVEVEVSADSCQIIPAPFVEKAVLPPWNCFYRHTSSFCTLLYCASQILCVCFFYFFNPLEIYGNPAFSDHFLAIKYFNWYIHCVFRQNAIAPLLDFSIM